MIDQGQSLRRTVDIIDLRDLTREETARTGTKAANLGDLARADFPVPDGFVLTIGAFDCFLEANALGAESPRETLDAASVPQALADELIKMAALLGDAPLAVRSSGVAEDLPGASFAGQYETVLDVRGAAALIDAVRRCWLSAFGERAAAYRLGQGQAPASMAVLVQRLVQADAAGVAFTANPVTGRRDETVVSAVRGLGERLVSGQVSPDEWIVRGSDGQCRAAPEGAIDVDVARAVAELARRVETHFGGVPQDIEWAVAGGELFLLQARPITALPDQVEWNAPAPGGWVRNFRIGEWLGDPVTPLFETWLLPRLDEQFWANNKRLIGPPPRPQPPYAVVNGWFYTSMNAWYVGILGSTWWLLRSPKAFRLAALMLPRTVRRAVVPYVKEWRDVMLPRYQAIVQTGEAQMDSLSPDELVRLVDDVALAAGDYLVWVAVVGGNGWKSEIPLARFYREHLASRIGGSHQRLLIGLGAPVPQPHAVHSLDWSFPTLGEFAMPNGDEGAAAIQARLHAERSAAEAAACAALRHAPKLLQRFERLLGNAQYFAVLREEVVGSLTLGWPLMRRALLALGAYLQAHGALSTREDIFFLTRDELLAALVVESPRVLVGTVAGRRAVWNQQRRLTPPLVLGEMPPMVARTFFPQAEAARSEEIAGKQGIRGLPASPGRATGSARIIRGPEEFNRLRPGDVLVAPSTAPAWTTLFARAVAVVTDSGSVLAHASLVAREYGIPAVVGVGDATVRIRDGQVVTVDGSVGIVEVGQV